MAGALCRTPTTRGTRPGRPTATGLAWHEWDLPDMPWDGSRIVIRRRRPAERRQAVAGGDDEAVEPAALLARRAPARVRLRRRRLVRTCGSRDPTAPTRARCWRSTREHAEPTWGPGQRSFAWSPDGAELALVPQRGRLRPARDRRARAGRRAELSRGWHRGLDWGRRGIVVRAVRAARTAAGGHAPRRRVGPARVLARGPVGGFEATGLVEPEAVTWRPRRRRRARAAVAARRHRRRRRRRPPLLVDVHGGPTGQAHGRLATRGRSPSCTRGWAVLQPNYRGSTGYGRAYAQALAGRWGDRDVADVAAGIRHAVNEGWADPARVAVDGRERRRG